MPITGDQGRLARRRARRSLRRAQHGRASTSPRLRRVVRRRSSPTTRRPRSLPSPRSCARRATHASLPSSARPGKTSTKDILGALCSAADADDLGRGEPEQRDRPPAHRLPARAGDAGARHRDGHARARADRGAVRDRAPGCRRRLVDRARASRARRHRRARRRGERRGDRRAARRAVSPSSPPTCRELEPHLGRTDIEIRRFDRDADRG